MLSKAQLERLSRDQITRLQAYFDQQSGDPHLDAMKANVVKDIVRDKLRLEKEIHRA